MAFMPCASIDAFALRMVTRFIHYTAIQRFELPFDVFAAVAIFRTKLLPLFDSFADLRELSKESREPVGNGFQRHR